MISAADATSSTPALQPPDGNTCTKRGRKRAASEDADPTVRFRLTHGKSTHEFEVLQSTTVAELKVKVEEATGVHANMQKLLYKGMLKNEQTVKDAGIVDGIKVLLMASKVEDIVNLAAAATTAPVLTKHQPIVKTPLCEKTEHKKVLDKGRPDDAEPGILGIKSPLPPNGLRSMLNSRGEKVRLTFKLELDQLWIGTNERTQKVGMGSIKGVQSEPIKGHPEYHILVLQLGPTEKSNYYIYWAPCQYIDSVRDAILGPFGSWL
ncbi:hypothetical protein PhCBS80983_g03756 [Powellomyces hirtus]|uniref:Ubiquitin-like domain-containing protein n=1 Tax=Powellomyces hirtus TaxID=109895 RepID=A0A507E1A7_9FUNG|nr:hypothetical protein PhCBS80983_g03756 [Powellomyces hirtus]